MPFLPATRFRSFPLRYRRIAPVAAAAAVLLALPALQPRDARAQAATAAPQRALPDFTALVDQVGPAVVNIRTVRHAPPAGATGSSELSDLLRRHFGPSGPRSPSPGPEAERDEGQRGVGSGFIVSADGHVLTNAHVIDGADEVIVRLNDRREFRARVVGTDKRSDVAVVKIEAQGLPTVRFGDVSALKAGEWVIAIGSPFDLDNTVTAGIVSARSRDTGELLPLIQTDVAINPGNSGGPLINLRGEVIGINSQIYSRSGGYMGISFAIPADEVQRIAAQLRSAGRVARGRIGVRVGEVTKEVAEALGLPRAAGALVRAADDDGPAHLAGILPGDIITRFDERSIEKWSDLPRFVGNAPPGSRHRIHVLRHGTPQELDITVVELEPEARLLAKADSPAAAAPPPGHAAGLGLRVSELPQAERQSLKLLGGVRVEVAEGPAARAGLQVGDILLAVGNREVSGPQQLEMLLVQADRTKPLGLLLRRAGLVQYAVLRPGR